MTQRSCARMATLMPAIDDHHLILQAPDRRHLFVALTLPEVAPPRVRIFGNEFQGLDEGDEAARWLSDFFERPVRLKRVPRDNQCRVSPERLGEHVAHTDRWLPAAGGVNVVTGRAQRSFGDTRTAGDSHVALSA